MTIYLSVISHHNHEELKRCLKPEHLGSPTIKPVLTDNLPEPATASYCRHHHIDYIANKAPQGFGANHNQAFKYCRKELGMNTSEDWFVIANPDLICSRGVIEALVKTGEALNAQIVAPNLYKDTEFIQQENSVREFPYIWDILPSFFRKGHSTRTQERGQVDWASGALLAFKASLFDKLAGFDEKYFLYYEDVDICWRANRLLKTSPIYAPEAKAVHAGQRKSHGILNRHFLWHLKSLLRFSYIRCLTFLAGCHVLQHKKEQL